MTTFRKCYLLTHKRKIIKKILFNATFITKCKTYYEMSRYSKLNDVTNKRKSIALWTEQCCNMYKTANCVTWLPMEFNLL